MSSSTFYKSFNVLCQQTIERLQLDGWTFDHWAMWKGYKYAGSITQMETKKNVEFCRVHDSKTTYKYISGYRYRFQLTAVMKRG